MIKSIRLQNFFSFEDETIELHPQVNVFVGINGSGKSNVLKAFRLIQEGMVNRLRELIYDKWGGFDAILFKGVAHKNSPITITVKLNAPGWLPDEEFYCYEIRFNRLRNMNNYSLQERVFKEGEDDSLGLLFREKPDSAIFQNPNGASGRINSLDEEELALPRLQALEGPIIPNVIRLALSESLVYDYFDTTPGSNIRRPVLATSSKRLFPDGSNLAQMINTLKINSKSSYRQIIEQLNRVNDRYTGIDFNVIGGNIELMLEEAGFDNSVHVTHISDGTLRYLCQMAIYYNEKRGNLICIDEPELGLHPDMIKSIRDAILESSESTQYIISTHSDHLLDLFELENIRVVEKDENNASRVKSLNPKQFEGWYETFSPGRMWTMGDFGGNRY